MFDQNGEPIESSSAMLRAVGNDSVNTKLKAGQSIKVRMLFHGNKSLTPTKLSLKARASERIANLKFTK
jgi:cell envelope opacity-associated protein A